MGCHCHCPILRQGPVKFHRPWSQENRFLLCTHPSKTLHLWRTGRSDGEPLPMRNEIGRSDFWLGLQKVTMNRSNIPHQGLEGGLYIVYIYIYIYWFFWEIWFLGIPLFWIMYKGPQMVDSRWGWLWILCRLSSDLCDGHSVFPCCNQTCSAENRQCYTLLMLPELEGQLLWSMQYLGCVLLWCLDLMLNTKLFHTYTNIHVHNI